MLGLVPRNAGVSAPSRHLGLVPADERRESAATIAAMADHLAAHVDLDAVRHLAATAATLPGEAWRPETVVTPVEGRPLVGVLAGRAFTFRYAETTELLLAAGCRVVEIDPLHDTALPASLAGCQGGGFPPVAHGGVEPQRTPACRPGGGHGDGLPTVAECAGQLYSGGQLGRPPDGGRAVRHHPDDSPAQPRLPQRHGPESDTL